MLGYGCVGHCQGGEYEAEGYASDGPEGDADFAEGRVDEAVDDGDEDYDGEGVDVLHDVVGDAVEFHCAGYKQVLFLGKGIWEEGFFKEEREKGGWGGGEGFCSRKKKGRREKKKRERRWERNKFHTLRH